MSRRLASGAAALAVLGATGIAAVGTSGAEEPRAPSGTFGGRALAPDGVLPTFPALPDLEQARAAVPTFDTVEGPRPLREVDREAHAGRWTAQLTRPAILRTWPDGRKVARIGRRTGYGARRVFAVGALRPGWVGVRAVQRPNGKLGWIPQDAVRLEPTRTTLVTDLSDRELTIRIDGRVRHRARVGIGRPGSTTPIGRYGVTDRLKGGGGVGAYGCCVIPLTGNQPNLPPGWTGGTRLALHGTPTPDSVGQEVSAGCLRMRDEDISRLLRHVPLGATMTVRA